MKPINHYSLEDFAERHRADFDLHEPRPDLWVTLEQQLDADAAKTAQPQMRIVPAATLPETADATSRTLDTAAVKPLPLPALRAQRTKNWRPYGMIGALLIVVVAAVLGEAWKSRQPLIMATHPASHRNLVAATPYLGPDAGVLAVGQGGHAAYARLDTAVRGMEHYYAAQLSDRKSQLSQLDPSSTAEWMRELVSLDSSYQQLKRELPRHPQPEVVLTAMNRNLQIRLDILDQQLELRGTDQVAQSEGNSEYALADSRSLADNVRHGHAH